MDKLVWIGPLVAGTGFLLFVVTLLLVRIRASEDKRWAASTGHPFFSDFGEAIVGRTHMKRPFAHLTATPTTLRLVFNWKRYEFSRQKVQRLGTGPLWWAGLVIQHSVPSYPARVFFLPKDMNRLRDELERLGYVLETGLSLG